jgi:mono/diheme cytochrome c family protein
MPYRNEASNWRRPTRGALAVPLAAAVAAISISSAQGDAKAPVLPKYSVPGQVIWLDQGWSAQERSWFHHVSQGTDTLPIPYIWFMALEQPDLSLTERPLLSDPAYLDRFGFIPSPKDANNPDGLPVGFARTQEVDPNSGKAFDHVGFTCAACHTGRMSYQGKQLFIDGGPAMTDVGKFRKTVAYALGLTAASPPRFLRFANRVLGKHHSIAQYTQLKIDVARLVAEGLGMELAHAGDNRSLEEGFGRIDALNRIGNEVFADQMNIKANYVPLTAPVAYPHIWDTSWFDWVQYNSSIEQPMVRNAGEAMGVRALVNFAGASVPRFTSTVPVDRLYLIEEALAGKTQPTQARRFTGLRSPAWPENFLPPINRVLAAQGAQLYERHCSSCHLPAPGSDAYWANPAWLPPNADGMRFLRPGIVPVSRIGTDEAQAVDMLKRTVSVPLSYGLINATATRRDIGVYSYGPALGQVVEKVVTRWYDSRTPPVPATDRNRWNGYRPNGIRAGIGADGAMPVYKARPLNGIWATAPFLHNGAVPTLYDLLSPYDERPKSFWLGNREFDPLKVGYAIGRIEGGFQLVAVDPNGKLVRGNGNGGHLFETPTDPAHPRPGIIGPTLSREQRMALIEFLKTL